MPDANHLIGLPFAAIGRSHDGKRRLIANHLEVAPEGGRNTAIVGILDDCREAPVLN